MQSYQSTPDFYKDYLEHKYHKYISKYKGPGGKWIYKYYRKKSSKAGQQAKEYRDELWNNGGGTGGMPAMVETPNIRDDINSPGRKLGVFTNYTVGSGVNQQTLMRSGKPKSHGFDSGVEGSRNVKTTKVYGNGVKARKKKTAQKFQESFIKKDKDRISKGIKSLESKERSLKEAANMYKKRQKSGSSTDRFNARMKEKQINQQLKDLRKRKSNLKNSSRKLVVANGKASSWNR